MGGGGDEAEEYDHFYDNGLVGGGEGGDIHIGGCPCSCDYHWCHRGPPMRSSSSSSSHSVTCSGSSGQD